MGDDNILPVLYDLAVTIGNETSLKPLLTRTLQRLLYHTSFSAGFVSLNLERCKKTAGETEALIDAAVGDFDLIGAVGKTVSLPCELLCGDGVDSIEQNGYRFTLLGKTCYRSSLVLPLREAGVIVLLAAEAPKTKLPLKQILQPVLAHLGRAIVLCQSHDAQLASNAARQAQTEQSLRNSEAIFNSLVELSPIGVGISSDGVTINANPIFIKMFGYDELGEIGGKSLLNLIAPQSRSEIMERFEKRAQGLPVKNIYETIGLRRDGTEFPMLVSAKRVDMPEGPRTLSFFIDLTEQKRTEYRLQTSNEMLQAVIENAPLRIFWKDRESHYLGCNTAFARDAGMESADELIGRDDFQMGWRDQAQLYRDDDISTMASDTPKLAFEEPQTTPDGREIWLRTSKVPLHDAQGSVVGVLGIYDDITEQKLAEAKIHQLAFYDPLTGLPNRRLLQDRLQQAFSVSARSGQHGAVLFLDLDNFKTLNDSRGHDVGDQLLAEVASRLNACVRDGDTVARLGGDEFVVVLESLSAIPDEAAAQADLVAEKIRESLGQTYRLDKHTFYTTPSIGVVLFLGHQESLDVILKHADTAMYQAKAAGRNAVRFYDPVMQAAIEVRAELEDELRQALDRQQFYLSYQVQVDSLRRTVGAEVLLRWQHPDRGLISPAQFIPLAEETGSIVSIGLWVLRTACVQIKAWQNDALTRDLTLAVNVSAKQFRRPDFVAQVQRVLLETGARPALLKLELTESIVLENVEDTISKMREIKSMGVSFSMDDFGTGYSSLQYLKRLPLDQIKIDQSFVRDVAHDPNDAAIVQTIIAMSEVMGLSVIAEGVETEAQREFLDLRGCHAFQGYLFGRPVPIAEFEAGLSAARI
ncbi:MAG: EAL domain-containing protein [Proteobacteria bacterium]|nr:EAL domain-containing protein [Pseudomonadota bacterium]